MVNRIPIEFIDLMFTSSSSSEDEEIYFEIISGGGCRHRVIPRVQDFIEEVVCAYNEVDFQQAFRVKRSTCEYLLNLLGPSLQKQGEDFGQRQMAPHKQLLIALWYLGTPDSYRSLTSKFGVGYASAWRAVLRVVKVLYSFRNYFIKWPSEAQASGMSQRIEERYKYPGIIGAVDGTHIVIDAPRDNKDSYMNRKGDYSIQLQVVCNDRLEFLHCFCGFPGSVHDMRVFKHSGLQDRCSPEYFKNNSHILADSAYTLQEYVMIHYRNDGHLSVEEIHFNKVHSQIRMMVERSIGLLKLRWRILLDTMHLKKVELIPYYILVCCILHNICLKADDTFQYPIEVPRSSNFLGPLEPTRHQKNLGKIKRDYIKNILNI